MIMCYSFRNLTQLCIPAMVVAGRQHCQAWRERLGAGHARPGAHILLSFDGACFISSLMSSTDLAWIRIITCQWGPSSSLAPRGWELLTHLGGISHWKCQLIIPFPGVIRLGALSSIAVWIHGRDWDNGCSLCLPYLYDVMCFKESSIWHTWQTSPTSWLLKCSKDRDSTFVHLDKVTLPVINLIFFFNLPFFLSTSLAAYGLWERWDPSVSYSFA